MLPAVGGILGSASFVGAYDAIPNLVHLYDMRRGLTSYSEVAPLVRIRRSSDNAESDFGSLANGDLDTAAIATFIGAGSGYVVTMYDQVGLNSPTQGTAGSQPLYVASGQNGRPTLRYNGSSHYLTTVFSSTVSQPVSTYAAASMDAAAIGDGITRMLYSAIDAGVQRFYKRDTDLWVMNATNIVSGGAVASSFYIWSLFWNGATSEGWKNGVSEISGDPGSRGLGTLFLGRWPGPSNYWDGDIAMFAVVKPSHDDTERAAMQTAINDYYGAF